MRSLWVLCLLMGCATPRAPAPAPAPTPTAEEQAAADAQMRLEHRAAWEEAHGEELQALALRAQELASERADLLDATGTSRVGEAVLEPAIARCGALLEGIRAHAAAVHDHAESYGSETLPLLPGGWNELAAVASQGWGVERRCAQVPEMLAAARRATTLKAQAEQQRQELLQGRKTGPAVKAVAAADAALRDVVTDALFLRYVDAIDAWQRAATTALRESRKRDVDARALARAQEASDARQADVGALNAAVTLAIAGRSGEVSDAVAAAVKALKKLGAEDQQAILDLFPPQVTPASSVLLQLVGDRL